MPFIRGSIVVLLASIFLCSQAVAALSSPWQNADIGSVGVAGSSADANGTFSVSGAGADIGSATDSFQYAWQSLSGDGVIVARVASLPNTNPQAKAGVMIRETLAANSRHALLAVTPSSGLNFQSRATTGGGTTSAGTAGFAAPVWLKLTRAGSAFTAYRSVDGITWTLVGSPRTLTMGSSVLIGLAVTSRNTAQLSTATFDNVKAGSANLWPSVSITSPADGSSVAPQADSSLNSITINANATIGAGTISKVQFYANGTLLNEALAAPYTFTWTNMPIGTYSLKAIAFADTGVTTNSAPVLVAVKSLPAPWQNADIGSVGYLGVGSVTNSTYTVIGSGADIWGTADAFQYVYQPLNGNGRIIARVASEQNADVWSKSGVMLRESLAANSRYAMLAVTPSNGLTMQWRSATAGSTSNSVTGGIAAPVWVRLDRLGDTISAYRSSNGVTWIPFGSTCTVPMTQNIFVGLAVSARNNTKTCTATFDNVTVGGLVFPPSVGTGTGLFASYFNTINLSGGSAPAFNTPALTRVDGSVNFNWGSASPDPLLNISNYSARWTGQIEPQFNEAYTIYVTSDDGVRLWIDNKLIIDAWTNHGATEYSGTIDAKAGEKVGIKLEYYQNTGPASVNLVWSSPSQPKVTIPQSQLYNATGFSVPLPTFSVTSPAFIEGIAWSPNGNPVAVTANAQTGTFFSDNNWFANVPLNLDGTATSVTVTQTGTGSSKQGSIVWWPLDLAGSNASDHEIVIRKGDSLLLTANGTGGVLTLDADGDGAVDFTGVPGQKFPCLYNSAGVYTAMAMIDGVSVGTLVVTVVDVDLTKPIADAVGFSRIKHIVVSPLSARGAVLFATGDLCSMGVTNVGNAVDGIDGQVWSINIKANKRGTPILVARVGGIDGAILAVKEVDEFTTENEGLSEALINEATGEGACTMIIRPYIPNVRFQFDMFAHTSTFLGGTRTMSLNTSDLDAISGIPLVEQQFDEASGETIGVIFVRIEMPSLEDKYCFKINTFQMSSDEQPVENPNSKNGDKCMARCNDLELCINGKGTLWITVTKANLLSGKMHEVKILNLPGETPPKFSPGNTAVAPHKLNCRVALPQQIDPVTAVGANVGKYDVSVNGVVFKECIKVTSKSVALNFNNIQLTQLDTEGVGYNNPQHDVVFGTNYQKSELGVLKKPNDRQYWINAEETDGHVCPGDKAGYQWHRDIEVKRWSWEKGDADVFAVTTKLFTPNSPPAGGNDENTVDDVSDSTPDNNSDIFNADSPSLAPGAVFVPIRPNPAGSIIAMRASAREWVTKDGIVVSRVLEWHSFITLRLKADNVTWERVGKNEILEGAASTEFSLKDAQDSSNQ